MNKIRLLILLLVLGALAVPVVNLVKGGPKGTDLTANGPKDPQAAKMAALLEGSCADCHVSNVAPPWYAVMPVASSLIGKDKADGLAWLDLREALVGDGKEPSEADLAKIEATLQSGEMPPARYVALHWKARLSAADRDAVLAWIKDMRVKRFAPTGLSPEVASAVVHPLPESLPVNPAKVALGKKLYHDKRLSGDNTLSCATCHDLKKGGTDQEKVSTGIRGQKGGINAPTTFNAAFQVRQFWDGRAADLAAQAAGPPENPLEMGSKFPQIIKKLSADKALKKQFKALYPQGITKETITDAIAEFEKTLLTPGSRFDQFLMGKTDALNEEEQKGWKAFQERGCVTCHVGRLLGGRSFEKMGRAKDYFADRGNPTPADDGRFSATKVERDRGRFKVPTLRNVDQTFPYFHDASAADLDTAVKKMAEYQSGVTLSDDETKALVAFLKTLTAPLAQKRS